MNHSSRLTRVRILLHKFDTPFPYIHKQKQLFNPSKIAFQRLAIIELIRTLIACHCCFMDRTGPLRHIPGTRKTCDERRNGIFLSNSIRQEFYSITCLIKLSAAYTTIYTYRQLLLLFCSLCTCICHIIVFRQPASRAQSVSVSEFSAFVVAPPLRG